MKTAVHIPVGVARLAGDSRFPMPRAVSCLFAHGSGSSRFSSRNQFVARVLEQHQLATLLIDLLTPEEEAFDHRTAQLRFDIQMLADRLVAIIGWLKQDARVSAMPIGLFGASTGGGAALMAAAARPADIAAVVSRGGRPDLAAGALRLVVAPTLLIVGGEDTQVIAFNKDAMRRMRRIRVARNRAGCDALVRGTGRSRARRRPRSDVVRQLSGVASAHGWYQILSCQVKDVNVLTQILLARAPRR